VVIKSKNKSFSKRCLRAVSLLLLAAMLCQDLAYANSEIKLALPSLAVPLRLDLPESVARIEESFRPQTSDTVIYLIQDAHTNPSAQVNIAKTLEILLENEKVRTVYLEGGFGDVSLNDFRSKAVLEKRKQVG